MLTTMGLDVARSGVDRTVCTVRKGNVVHPLNVWTKADTMETCGRVIPLIRKYHPSKIYIDADGLGAGVFDRLREQGYPVIAFHGQRATEKTDSSGENMFANWRSYAWWHLRELLDPNGDFRMALPPDEELMGELCAPRYRYTSAGKIQVEPKEEIKKRLDRSTDRADSLAYAFCDLDYSVFEDAWGVVTGSQAQQMVDELQRKPVVSEEQQYERLLWGNPEPADIFDLF